MAASKALKIIKNKPAYFHQARERTKRTHARVVEEIRDLMEASCLVFIV